MRTYVPRWLCVSHMYYGMQDVIAHSGDKGKKGAAPTTKAAAKQVSMYVPASHSHCTVGGMALPSLTLLRCGVLHRKGGNGQYSQRTRPPRVRGGRMRLLPCTGPGKAEHSQPSEHLALIWPPQAPSMTSQVRWPLLTALNANVCRVYE